MAAKKTSKSTTKTTSTRAKKTTSTTATKAKAATTAASSNEKELAEMLEAMKKEVAKVEASASVGAKKDKKKGLGWGTVILLVILIFLIGWGCFYVYQQMQARKVKAMLPEVIGFLSGDMKLKEITEFTTEDGVYKFSFTFEEYPDEPFTSYMSKDGKTFFVEGYSIEELRSMGSETGADGAAEVTTPEEVSKSANPELVAYVMADCPYGTQMQGVMLDAIDQAPEMADNMQVRYIFDEVNDDGTVMSMRGETEAQEQLRQVCIREEQPTLYWDYVGCYAEGGTSETCLTESGVNAANLNACMSDVSRGIAFAKTDMEFTTKHMVTGSPTLVLNDIDTVSEASFGGRNAQGLKNIVCASADNALSFCDQTLSSEVSAAQGGCE